MSDEKMKHTYYVSSCSGCYESNDGYPPKGTTFDKNGVPLGIGCHECGYQGKRRIYFEYPAYIDKILNEDKP